MRKIFSIIFAGVILFNICGDFFLFRFRQYLAKTEMKEWIQTGSVSPASILLQITNPETNPDFKWTEPGEFSYKGKLYDVVSESVTGNQHNFTCLYDKSEEALINNYTACQVLASRLGSQDKSRHQQVLMHLLIKQALVRTHVIICPSITQQIGFPVACTVFKSLQVPPDSPPPKAIS